MTADNLVTDGHRKTETDTNTGRYTITHIDIQQQTYIQIDRHMQTQEDTNRHRYTQAVK